MKSNVLDEFQLIQGIKAHNAKLIKENEQLKTYVKEKLKEKDEML